MSNFTAAHRGYEYQDLLVACRLVDLLLGVAVEVRVDEKLVDDDVFDDLTTEFSDGSRERVQVKYTSDDERPLTAATFTNKGRGLKLDRVFAAILADRLSPGADAAPQTYRIVLRDTLPEEAALTAVLGPAGTDPGPFLPTLQTVRLAFDADELWSQMERSPAGEPGTGDGRFSFLADADPHLARSDLVWACSRLVVEVAAPAASRDLTSPGPAEALLLSRVREEVGAGVFPNERRDPVDVAAAMIGIARYARAGGHMVTREQVISHARLQTDFGSVAVGKPVDTSVQVSRAAAVQRIAGSAAELAESGGTILVIGAPGQGKTWLCHQAKEELSARGWLVAQHYCYLNDADSDRSERVLAERVFGSLIARLADGDPRTVEGQLPVLAADEDKLVRCIARSAQCEPERPVALVIDGIDHITRVQAGQSEGFDPSLSLAETLSVLELPSGSVLIVLSQPGAHLSPLEEAGAATVRVEGLDHEEIRALAERRGLLPADGSVDPTAEPRLIEDEGEAEAFLDALAARSEGNALYATYLCSEASKPDAALLGPAAAVRSLPAYAGTLENYYSHLYSTLGSDGGWVADVICWIDFAVTRGELRAIRPDAANRVGRALDVLAPVLVESATQGGVRVYHESFARYLRGVFRNDPDAKVAVIGRITAWLDQQGIFNDTRAFRSLLPLLAEAGRYADVAAHIDREFVVRSAVSGFPASAIIANLATAIRCATRLGDWPLVARCVELSRAAESFETGLLGSGLVGYSDVPITLLGPSVVAERLLYEGRTVMAARDGLQMCAAVDEWGAVAPWPQYMAGFVRESKSDNTAYGPQSDRAVDLAVLRGRLRLAAAGPPVGTEPDDNDGQCGTEPDGPQPSGDENGGLDLRDLFAPVDWTRVADWVEQQRLPAFGVVDAVADTRGAHEIPLLICHLDHPGAMCLAFADYLADHPEHSEIGSARRWAAQAVAHGVPPGALHHVLSIDADLFAQVDLPDVDSPGGLLDLTRRVQERSVALEGEGVGAWFDACTAAARQDPLSLNAAEALIAGEGWYKCWLRFTIGLARAEAAAAEQRADLAVEALGCLSGDLRPFVGDPRACDLFSLQRAITDTIWRATALVDDGRWAQCIRLLDRVSASITTTLYGEVGGPIPPDLVIAIAVDGAGQGREAVAADLLAEQTEHGSAGRFYADLAEFELLGARLALASDDQEEALAHWHQACRMLASYGSHKDMTIFELLNPLPSLIAADRCKGRERVEMAQPLCERIPAHTNGKETYYALTQWWQLLSLADPAALARLAASRLLQRCNHPNWRLHGALEALWRSWGEHADPVLAGALRLTLDTPLESKDAEALSCLVVHAAPGSVAGDLATWLLARADERPISYSSSNSDEILEIDDQKVADLNSVAATVGLPNIAELRQELGDQTEQDEPETSRSAPAPDDEDHNDPLSYLPEGPAGLSHAIRSWRKRPYNATHPSWSADRFADAIEVRLLELVENGRNHDAEWALRSLAEACEFGTGTELLREIAERLEPRRHSRLAAISHTLVWTRTRGRGGYVNFGGETEIQALRRATELDPGVALEIVAEETERVVASGQYGSYGVTQALIHAFCEGALYPPDKRPTDVAFAAWDEAFVAIDYRAPQVHEFDNPMHPYVSARTADSDVPQGELDTAFALATLASLAHPGREKKRRSLLAAQLLLSERPAAIMPAIDIAMDALSDPATTAWLLRLIEQHRAQGAPLTAEGKRTLIGLATKPHLVVRALARRLLTSEAPPMPLPDPADPALLRQADEALWTPLGAAEAATDEPPVVNQLVQSVAGCRLGNAEPALPGLSEAVRSRVATAMETEDFQRLRKAQLDAYADRIAKRIPDAFLIWDQTVEEALHLAAAGSRAALIAAGDAVSDLAAWEDNLALTLLDDPGLPIAIEARRTPRPQISIPLPLTSPAWAEVSTAAATADDREPYEHLLDQNGLLATTLHIEPSSTAERVEQCRYQGWRIVASAERRTIEHPAWSQHSQFTSHRYRAIELRELDAIEALDLPPAALIGDIRVWGAVLDWPAEFQLPDQTSWLFGVDLDVAAAGDGLHTLGVHPTLLAPTPGLVAVLDLQPGEAFTLHDSQGCGLALVTWRAAYETSGHHLPSPSLVGSAVLARPDLFERLQHVAGDRLVLRDFVALAGNQESAHS